MKNIHEKYHHVVNEIMTKNTKILRKYYLFKTRAKRRNKGASERNKETIK